MRQPRRDQEGSAMIIATLILFMLGVLATVVASTSVTRSRVAVESRFRTEAMSAAEAGIALQVNEIVDSNGGALTANDGDNDGVYTLTYDLGDGKTAVIEVTDLGRDGIDNDASGSADDGDEIGVVRIRSQGNIPLGGGNAMVSRRIETFLSTSLHSLFYKATYVGNVSNDPTYEVAFGADGTDAAPGSVSPLSNWDTMGKTTDADYIEGDVYVKGLTGLKGGTPVHGDVDAAGSAGTVTGSPVDGYTTTDNATEIAPPDLTAQNFDSIADLIVSDVDGDGVLEFSGPEAGNSAATSAFGGKLSNSSYVQSGISDNFDDHDAPYIHLGNNSAGTIPLPDNMSGKLILIKGNMWLHSTSQYQFDMPSGGDVQATIVVEGNFYVADDLNYNNSNNALLFMVKSPDGQESYNDKNGNNVYDAGDTILNDTGVIGTYEGRAEGSGNIFFGDPRYGTGGVSDGYMYAENNVYLTALNPSTSGYATGQDAIYGTYGFLSAGNHMYLGDPRSSGSNYVNFRVKYDDRLETGAVSFKGAPGPFGGGFEGLQVLSWEEIPPQ